MGNCLVTKLKESVNNNTLPILGCLYLGKASKSFDFGFYSNLSVNAKALGSDGSVQTYNNEYIGDHVTKDVYYNIQDAKDVITFECREFDNVDFVGCINVINLAFIRCRVKANGLPVTNTFRNISFLDVTIDNLDTLVAWCKTVPLNSITFSFTTISSPYEINAVDLAVMGNSIQRLTICKECFVGNVEDFVAARRALIDSTHPEGYTTGTITLNVCTPTFKGVEQSLGNHTLSWTASTITFDGETITA